MRPAAGPTQEAASPSRSAAQAVIVRSARPSGRGTGRRGQRQSSLAMLLDLRGTRFPRPARRGRRRRWAPRKSKGRESCHEGMTRLRRCKAGRQEERWTAAPSVVKQATSHAYRQSAAPRTAFSDTLRESVRPPLRLSRAAISAGSLRVIRRRGVVDHHAEVGPAVDGEGGYSIDRKPPFGSRSVFVPAPWLMTSLSRHSRSKSGLAAG